MKKFYIKPEMAETIIKVEGIICTGSTIGSGNQDLEINPDDAD